MNPMLPEEYLSVEARLQIVSADPAHVLDQHGSDLPGLNVRDQPLPVRAVEVAAGPAVVGIVVQVRVAVLCGVGFEVKLLVCNGA